MVSSTGMARVALLGLLGVVGLSGCSVVVGAVLDGKDSDGGAPATCTSDPMCDDGNPCTEDRCPDGRCSRPFVSDGTPCNGDGMCLMGACRPCPLGGCRPTCDTVACPPGSMCVEGECIPEGCDPVTRPCPAGNECLGGMCVEPPPIGCGDGIVDVSIGEECDPPDGVNCLPNCQRRCAVHEDCDDTNDCTVDVCDPVINCTYSPLDADGDGAGSVECGGADCNDTDPTIYAGAMEICNDADDDCDGLTDNVTSATGWWADTDGDGFGDPTMFRCPGTTGGASNGDDCYDANPDAHPYTNPLIPAPFFAMHRGDGSFDYDCDGTEIKQYGPPACSDGGTNSCPGSVSCTGSRGLVGATTCGDTYVLFACALCRLAGAGMCGPGGPTGMTVTLGCR